MKKDNQSNPSLQIFNNFVIFQTENGKVNIDVFFKNDTLWLTQKKMSELFEINVSAISKHLKNIFKMGELDEKVVVSILEHTTQHGAITGKTAAEIIYSEADAKKAYMGLKTWGQAPKGKILKLDVAIAKNYLEQDHLEQLERIVSAYLDLAENRAQRHIVMNMKDWVIFLDKFLSVSDYSILMNAGKFTALEAKIKAEAEYEKYRVEQDKNYISDFDYEVKKLLESKNKNKK